MRRARTAPAPARPLARPVLPLLAAAWLLGLGACASAPPVPGVAELMQRPAERQLAAGLRAYDDARYTEAEAALQDSLRRGLQQPADRAAAHKTLAFLYCTSQRLVACAEAFRAARRADPAFALSRAESGHPLWGPVYRDTLP